LQIRRWFIKIYAVLIGILSIRGRGWLPILGSKIIQGKVFVVALCDSPRTVSYQLSIAPISFYTNHFRGKFGLSVDSCDF